MKKRIPIKLIIVLVVIFIIYIVSNISSRIEESQEKSKLESGFELLSAEAYEESWKMKHSDIAYMTLWDKYEMGLAIHNNSDTDGDGLTDKEEIEIYDTDPLKVSTAGDLYTDAYKVQQGMDPLKSYDYEGEHIFPHNTCPEVKLEATTPFDFNAVVNKHTVVEYLNLEKIYAHYTTYNYSGDFVIDLSDILSQNNIEKNELEVYVSDGTKTKSCKITTQDNLATLKYDFDSEQTYDIYIAQKAKFTFGSLFSGEPTVSTLDSENINGSGIIYISPLVNIIFRIPLSLDYQDMNNDDLNTLFEEKAVEELDITYMDIHVPGSKNLITPTDILTLKSKYEFFRSILPFFEVKDDNKFSWQYLIFAYKYYDDINELIGTETSEDDTTDSSNTTPTFAFDIHTDTLPFGNFTTELCEQGNCVGISYLTSKLYNTGTFPSTGAYQNTVWNIGESEDNATLMNKGLSDYKDSNFITDHSSNGNKLDKNLTSSEIQFKTMIEASTLRGNYVANSYLQYKYGGANAKAKMDYALIDEMKRRLDSNQILTLYLRMKSDTGHAVNVYGYETDTTNPDTTWFYIYDTNLSDTITLNKLKVTKKLSSNGTNYTFDYSYLPTTDPSYGATSNSSTSSAPIFLVIDDNWQDINPVNVEEENSYGQVVDGEDFGATNCSHKYAIVLEDNNRTIRIQCSNLIHSNDPILGTYQCFDELTPKDNVSFKKFKTYYTTALKNANKANPKQKTYKKLDDDQLKTMYNLFKAQEYADSSLRILETISNNSDDIEKTYKKYLKNKNNHSTSNETNPFINFIGRFNDINEVAFIISEEECDINAAEFYEAITGKEYLGKVAEWSGLVGEAIDNAQLLINIYKLSIASQDFEENPNVNTGSTYVYKTIDSIESIISLIPNLYLGPLYSSEIKALTKSCELYFKHYEDYTYLHTIYQDYFDDVLSESSEGFSYLFNSSMSDKDELSDFMSCFSNSSISIREAWTQPEMPTASEMISRLTEERNGTCIFDNLSPSMQMLLMKYVEFRIHYEFEQETGITLEYYFDLKKPELIFGIWENILGFDAWEKAPWEKKLNPKKYPSYSPNI